MSAINSVTGNSLPTAPPLPGTSLDSAPVAPTTDTPIAAAPPAPPTTSDSTTTTSSSLAKAQAELAAMGVNPPSHVGTVLKNAAIFGGIGLGLGLAASLLPFVGPIAGVLAGAAGAAIGAIKGASDYQEQRSIYNMQLAWAQQQILAGRPLTGPGSANETTAGLPTGNLNSMPMSIDDVVSKSLAALDADGDGKIVVSSAPKDAQKLLAYIDAETTGEGHADGIVTADELKAALKSFDVRSDGTLDAIDRQVISVTIDNSNAPIVNAAEVAAAKAAAAKAAADAAAAKAAADAAAAEAASKVTTPPTQLVTTAGAPPVLTGL